MPSRKSSQWQSRRKPSLGKLRRAHPASGATWNVQVVRGKMTSKCLWHACRALALGMVLMLLGAGMATIGYYADQLSIGQEIRGNATVRVKNESRGFHLNNLSYVGPIIMGFGGFIVVAACVMTFEARDSAAKVVPARFKLTNNDRSNIRSNNSSISSARRANELMQATKWDHHLGVFRTSPAEPSLHVDRQALTAALIHFSRTMGNSPRQSPEANNKLSRSGSVPNLISNHRSDTSTHLSPYRKQLLIGKNFHHHHHHHQARHLSKSRNSRISSSLVHRASRESTNSLLHPGMLHLQRHALSVDETDPFKNPSESPHESLSSVIMADSHEGRLRDRTKRSDTAKRHVLARQKPIEREEPRSPKRGYLEERRRSSTTSDVSNASRWICRRTSSASRTPSIDSRSVQVELHSPEKNRSSPRTPRRFNSGQSSTPSVELRSQLSVCSEPITIRQLSVQSSLEPCLLEESPELEDKEHLVDANTNINNNSASKNDPSTCPTETKKPRPESLVLNLRTTTNSKEIDIKKLHRSKSSRTFYRPKPRTMSEYEQIYFISPNGNTRNEDDLYDSVQVINERRSKILNAAQIHKRENSSKEIVPQSEKAIIQSTDEVKLDETYVGKQAVGGLQCGYNVKEATELPPLSKNDESGENNISCAEKSDEILDGVNPTVEIINQGSNLRNFSKPEIPEQSLEVSISVDVEIEGLPEQQEV